MRSVGPVAFLNFYEQVLMLACPGVIVATISMACFSVYILPYGWDWNTALYFGAMTSATDPVAVVALMKVNDPSHHRRPSRGFAETSASSSTF